MPCCLFSSHFVTNQEAKEQLSPLSAALDKLQQEKQELVERKRQKQEEGQEKVDTFFFHCRLRKKLLSHSHGTGQGLVDYILLSLLSLPSFGVTLFIFA